MNEIAYGRLSANLEAPCILFLIGMRVNRLTAVATWLPIGRSMGAMIRELAVSPESGLLSVQGWWWGRNTAVQQYWRSTDHLIAYANDSERLHRPAWTDFYRKVGVDSGAAVGIWHETVVLEPGRVECIYGNMPPFGLGAAVGTLPATGHRKTAAGRLGKDAPSA
jgi:hypothetical protein